MPILLHLETSTTVCSVCLSEEGKVLYELVDTNGQNHSELLGVFVQKALQEAKRLNKQPEAIAVGSGPGSYTGLRIGVSMAKGLCYGFSIPLIAINSLHIMAQGVVATHSITDDAVLCPMIDARRMEVYTAFFSPNLETIKETWAEVLHAGTFIDLQDKKLYIFGNGAEKSIEIVQHPTMEFIPHVYPLASNMIPLAEKAFEQKKFEDMAYFEPFYLKEFMTSIPKNKLAY
jgi:tRNA threonylcarbamoyladenosine biosynthesis protein TsaB